VNTRNDFIVIPGRLLFEDIYLPVVPPKADPAKGKRYSATVQTSKSAKAVEDLFGLIEQVAVKTWGATAGKYLDDIQRSIDDGWPPSKGLVSVRDGDHPNNQPERNKGFYLITSSLYERRGIVGVYGIDGAPLSGNCAEAPKAGDGVLMLMNVWAQPQYDRVNFTLVSIRKAIEGEAIGGGPSEAERQEAMGAFASAQLPASIDGVRAAPALAARAGGAPQAAGWGPRSAEPASAPEPTPTRGRLVKKI
jgi:hypothetical protein